MQPSSEGVQYQQLTPTASVENGRELAQPQDRLEEETLSSQSTCFTVDTHPKPTLANLELLFHVSGLFPFPFVFFHFLLLLTDECLGGCLD